MKIFALKFYIMNIIENWHLPLNISIRRKIGRAVGNWKLLNHNDRVLIGLSGGKDSLLLLHALDELSKRSPVKFQIAALTVKIQGMNLTQLQNYCEAKKIQYFVQNSDIMEIIKIRNEKSPCSLCANMRRGILSSFAAENGYNKIALGHSIDDAVETFFLNLFQTGRAKSFKPLSFMSRTAVTVIRPLVLLSEAAIIDEVNRLALPVLKTPCPYANITKRQNIREFISQLKINTPDLCNKIIHALETLSSDDNWRPADDPE